MNTCENHPTHWRCTTCGETFSGQLADDGTDLVIEHSMLDEGHHLTREPRPLVVGDIVAVRHIGNVKVGPVTFVGSVHVKVAVDRWIDEVDSPTVETRKPISEVRFVSAGRAA